MVEVNSPKEVDIIIPVHNRFEHTKQTIESLLKNTPHDLFNLYVVDDVSTEPEIKPYLEDLSKNYPVFFNEVNIGPGASRNMVTNWITEKKLRSKYLYHSDNDVYFKDHWLEKLLSIYEMNADPAFNWGVKVLGASCHPYLQNKEAIELSSGTYPLMKIGIKDAVSGYSQLMTWETWDKYGPFDETMRNAEKKIMGSEDWAFCQKIVKDGYLVGSIEPEVVVPCGKTNTYGDQATGSETFKETEGVMVK